MEQKMRIQLFDPEFNQISDRLVTQGPEFDKGPKNIEQVNGGGIKVEFSLFTAQDVDLCITYLRQLVGDLPLDAPKQKRGRKKLNASSPNFRDELIDHISTILSSTELVEYLKAEGFVFTTLDYLEDLGNPIAVSKSHRKRYKWLVRLIRQAKNPLNNRYDISILIGFRGEKLMVYSGEEILHKATLTNSIEIHIKVPVKFKVKFPPYMQHDERAQFRAQMEKLKNRP